MFRKVLAAAALLALTLTACGGDSEPDGAGTSAELTKISFGLGATPSISSAPYYLGVAKGFFEDVGIDLEVVPSESPSVGLAGVENGQLQFASVDLATIALAKTEDPDVNSRLLSVTYARAPYVLFSLKGKGDVATPEDLSGKTFYGTVGSSKTAIINAWIKEQGIENVTSKDVEGHSRDPLLLSGEVDVIASFISSIPPLEEAAEKQGDELLSLVVADYGLEPFYGTGVTARQDFVEENEQLTRDFLAAYIRSFQYAFDNPEEAGEVLNQEFPEISVEQTIEGIKIQEKLMTDNGRVEELGQIDPEIVEATIDYIDEELDLDVNPEDLYLTGFLPGDA